VNVRKERTEGLQIVERAGEPKPLLAEIERERRRKRGKSLASRLVLAGLSSW